MNIKSIFRQVLVILLTLSCIFKSDCSQTHKDLCHSKCYIAIKKLMNMVTLTKSNISLKLAYNFQMLILCHYGRVYDRTQADMVLEK